MSPPSVIQWTGFVECVVRQKYADVTSSQRTNDASCILLGIYKRRMNLPCTAEILALAPPCKFASGVHCPLCMLFILDTLMVFLHCGNISNNLNFVTICNANFPFLTFWECACLMAPSRVSCGFLSSSICQCNVYCRLYYPLILHDKSF